MSGRGRSEEWRQFGAVRWENVTDWFEPQWTFFGAGLPGSGEEAGDEVVVGLALPQLLESLSDEVELDMMYEKSLRKEKFMSRLKKMLEEELDRHIGSNRPVVCFYNGISRFLCIGVDE